MKDEGLAIVLIFVAGVTFVASLVFDSMPLALMGLGWLTIAAAVIHASLTGDEG